MNLEWIKEFVALVKSNAPLKAYEKKLGLNRDGLKIHLGKLAEYEAMLVKKPTKVSPQHVAEALGAKIVAKPKSAPPSLKQLRERKETLEETTKVEEEKEDGEAGEKKTL
jgi:hypothetical protein